MKKNNPVQEKCFKFSVKIIQVCKDLKINGEFELSKQLLKSATSIGANVEEAIGASSKKDFVYKMTLAYKEAREARYWIRLLIATNQFPQQSSSICLKQILELERLLVSIIKTSKLNF